MKKAIEKVKPNKKAVKKPEKEVKAELFSVSPNRQVIAQYLRVYLSNQRQGTSSTKRRGEVSGSGAKPWAQKGTGRARVGEKRTPIWRHGGIIHGPKPKSWTLAISEKLKDLALISAISEKLTSKNLTVIDKLHETKGKTKAAEEMLEKLDLTGKTLFVADTVTPDFSRSLSNIKNASIASASRLNAYQVLKAKNIIFTKSAFEIVSKRLEKAEKKI